MLGDLFMKECYFGVSGVKAKEVTNGFEHIFQEYLCVSFPQETVFLTLISGKLAIFGEKLEAIIN